MTAPLRWAGLLLLTACTGGLAATTGTQAVPDPVAAILKTAAVRGARQEISRSSGGAQLRSGVYLDTMVGPTPEAQLYEWSHPRPWLEAMVSTQLVEGLFGVPGRRDGLTHSAFAIEVGEPFPGTADTLQIVYAWCVRRFPVRAGNAGTASVWRDLFVRADTGWSRVGHLRAVAPAACSP
ncbi:MAG TPA: hypothetical protein VFI13_10825 [Gemmatimonadales bacterium]|nr:hypothetical protein [Gemmatimonadales bacterium]